MDRFVCKNESQHVYYIAEYNKEKNYIYSNWRGFVTIEEVIAGCNMCIEALKAFSCPYLLNDNSRLYGPWQDANDWIVKDWAPRAIDAGLKFFAHVISPNLFVEVSARDMEARFESVDFTIRLFEDKAKAEIWLQEQKL